MVTPIIDRAPVFVTTTLVCFVPTTVVVVPFVVIVPMIVCAPPIVVKKDIVVEDSKRTLERIVKSYSLHSNICNGSALVNNNNQRAQARKARKAKRPF